MQDYRAEFIEFALAQGVLQFGEFELKSGRRSPYFFNSGRFRTGATLARLGQFYARAISASGVEFDILYGAAYKGIPLVAAVAVAFSEHFSTDLPYCFNRKEEKDHGEKGSIVGAALSGRVLIVDDVISAGTSVRESLQIIAAHGARAAGVAISLDRQERGAGNRSAIQEIEQDRHLAVIRIIGLDDLVEYLRGQPRWSSQLREVEAYRRRYGVNP